ncbi:hypothetical protein PYW08_001928 [Mythimna loreyi]|uniref:Uncharacterized protein n=1 Tax=Mythimna loreyi TaxID=667449 RepID=A0ACC2R0B4_9NEOP|nr:hypothetical protein PYW08_001928 [Mythimna loreyi]
MKTALCLFVAIAAFALVQESAAVPLGLNIGVDLNLKKLITDTIDTVHNIEYKLLSVVLQGLGLTQKESIEICQKLKGIMENASKQMKDNVDPKKVQEDMDTNVQKLAESAAEKNKNVDKNKLYLALTLEIQKHSTTGASENTGATATDGSSANVGSDVTSDVSSSKDSSESVATEEQ